MTNSSSNSSQKPSLLGRKRTKDLQQALQPETEHLMTNSIDQVKKTLLDLQENIFSDSLVNQTASSPIPSSGASSSGEIGEKSLESESTTGSITSSSPLPTPLPAPILEVAAAPRAIKVNPPTVELKKTTFASDKVSRVTFEQEAFEYLLKFHHNLRNPHQAIRVTHSLSEQNRKLLEAIKKIINHYAESLKHTSLNQQEIAQKCQALLDTLVSRLSREGVKLRALSLIPERF